MVIQGNIDPPVAARAVDGGDSVISGAVDSMGEEDPLDVASDLGSCSGLMELEDIEDLIGDGPGRSRPGPTVRARRKKAVAKETTLPEPPVCDSVVPGTQRVHVRTWGCTHNSSDSEYMAGLLASYGYRITGVSSFIA